MGAQGWEIASLAPPLEPDPENDIADFERDNRRHGTRPTFWLSPAGMIYTVSGTGISPGTRTTRARLNGKPERIGRETSNLNPS